MSRSQSLDRFIRSSAAAEGRRRCVRAVLRVESLEGRQMLSQASPGPYFVPVTSSLTPVAVPILRVAHVHQQHHAPTSGLAFKLPKFYELYTGPRRADLNAVAASGKFSVSGPAAPNLVLSGFVLGRIKTSDQGVYVWGIDRGGAVGPGPFPNRPNIVFDSVVAVEVGPSGVSGFVTDLKTGATTPLSSSDIRLKGNEVQATVSLSELPSTGSGPYRFNFWPRPSLGDPSTVASFAPEFTDAAVVNP
jgi:hypothetical protein